jgi:hypothetical protein
MNLLKVKLNFVNNRINIAITGVPDFNLPGTKAFGAFEKGGGLDYDVKQMPDGTFRYLNPKPIK